MKVKVNIIYMSCILITEAVTVSNLIAIISLVSEIWLAMDRHTDRQTITSSSLNFSSHKDFENNESHKDLLPGNINIYPLGDLGD